MSNTAERSKITLTPALSRVTGRGRNALRGGRSPAAVVVFLALFAILLVFVCQFYLIPTLQVVKSASHAERMKMAAYARLILAILLFILFAALSITFRFGRFFFPRPQPPRTKTQYVDAWAEAGKRASTPSDGVIDEGEQSE